MKSLSLSMIVKNEEAHIARVLACVRDVVDEMVIVDTGSSDRTVEIAREMGARVEFFPWCDDFAAARQYALDCCTTDWALVLDADDVLPEHSQNALVALMNDLDVDDPSAVYLTYQSGFSMSGGVERPMLEWAVPRLIRLGVGAHWIGAIHEYINVDYTNTRHRPDIVMEHRPVGPDYDPERNVRILEAQMAKGDRSHRTLFYYANEMRDRAKFPIAIEVYREFLTDAPHNWERYDAHISMFRCLHALKRYPELHRQAATAIIEEPARAEAYAWLGRALYDEGRFADAIAPLEAASVCKLPTVGFVYREYYTYWPSDFLSVCYYQVGDYERALALMPRAARGNPDEPRMIENVKYMVQGIIAQGL